VAALLLATGALLLIGHQALLGGEASGGKRSRGARPRRPTIHRTTAKRRRPPPPKAEPEEKPVPPPAAAPEPEPEKAALSTLLLTETFVVEGDPAASFAVVNGRAVRAGERVGGHLLVAIEKDRVRLGDGAEIAVAKPDKER
jgi:hypothetical protein